MSKRLRPRFKLFSFGQIHPAARIPWSSIRRIGQSRLLALTIIVPFLGSLLLFNQYVVDVLVLSPEIVKRFLSAVQLDSQTVAREVTLTRLYYVYFGLCFLGIGSGLFALLCPLEIKTYDSSRSYLTAEAPLVSRARMGIILPAVAQRFDEWFGAAYSENWSITRKIAAPDELCSMFSQVIKAIYVDLRTDEKPEEAPEDREGRPDVSKIASALYTRTTVRPIFAHNMEGHASHSSHRNDVLMLHYIALDHSKPWFRIIVSAFYAAGFVTLLWPTGLTFLQLAKNTILQ